MITTGAAFPWRHRTVVLPTLHTNTASSAELARAEFAQRNSIMISDQRR